MTYHTIEREATLAKMTYAVLYRMNRKSLEDLDLKFIADEKNEWKYTKLLKEREDFSTLEFEVDESGWKYDKSTGRIKDMKFDKN